MPTPKRPRRAPADADRRRDPERTREAILRAAVQEFGAHGYAGARTSRIAAAAGANAQLISYHFNGKAGLYRAVKERWRGVTEAIPDDTTSIADIAAAFVHANSTNPDYSRLLAWEALGDFPEGDDGVHQRDERAAFYRHVAADLRRRQDAGELPGDIAAEHILLALTAIAAAPVSLPHLADLIVGEDPGTPEFQAAYADSVRALVRALGAS